MQWRMSTTSDGTEWHVSEFEFGPLRWQFNIMQRPSTGVAKWSVCLIGDAKKIALKKQQQSTSVDEAKKAVIAWLHCFLARSCQRLVDRAGGVIYDKAAVSVEN